MTLRNQERLRAWKRKVNGHDLLELGFDEVCAIADTALSAAHDEWQENGDDDAFFREVERQCEVLKDAAQDAIAARLTARSVQA